MAVTSDSPGQRIVEVRAMAARLALVGLITLLVGCDPILYEDLAQREANQIVSALRRGGIHAERHAVDDELFSVTVGEGDFADAIALLEQHGLPRERFDSMADVFGADSLMSTPLQERARLAYALSQELTRSLMAIDGVMDARVHLTLSRERPLSDEQIPAKASVLLNHVGEFDIGSVIPDVKMLVSKGVPDLSYRDVSVVAIPQQAPPMNEPGKPEESDILEATADSFVRFGPGAMTLMGFGLIAAIGALFAVRNGVGKRYKLTDLITLKSGGPVTGEVSEEEQQADETIPATKDEK